MKRLIKKASGSVKIKQTLKDKVNSDLMRYNTSGVDSYFEKIPLEPIFEVLEKHNIVAVQEDGTNWEGFLTGRDEKVRFDLVLEENGERKPIENAIDKVNQLRSVTGRFK
jgi:hypothetical protein